MNRQFFKIGLVVLTAFFTLASFALPGARIQNLEGQFSNDLGQGRATLLQLPNEAERRNLSFNLIKESGQFRVQTDDSEFIWDSVPDFLLDLDQANWNGINANSGANKIELSVDYLKGDNHEEGLKVVNLRANCQGTSTSSDFLFQLLGVCSQKGTMSFKKLEIVDKNPFIPSLVKVISKTLNPLAETTTLDDFSFNVSKGSFNFKVKADLDFKVNVKGNGKISFNESNSEIRVRVDKVKASFLTVTERVFKEVEKLNLNEVKVQRPYIIITLP